MKLTKDQKKARREIRAIIRQGDPVECALLLAIMKAARLGAQKAKLRDA